MKGKVIAESKRNGATQYTLIEYLVGPNPDGARLSLHCHTPFLEGEPWQRHTSPPDPKFGSDVVWIHQKCLCYPVDTTREF